MMGGVDGCFCHCGSNLLCTTKSDGGVGAVSKESLLVFCGFKLALV